MSAASQKELVPIRPRKTKKRAMKFIWVLVKNSIRLQRSLFSTLSRSAVDEPFAICKRIPYRDGLFSPRTRPRCDRYREIPLAEVRHDHAEFRDCLPAGRDNRSLFNEGIRKSGCSADQPS